jgi:hypothetical protein
VERRPALSVLRLSLHDYSGGSSLLDYIKTPPL